MAQVAVYNLQGEKARELELNDAVFGVQLNEEVIHQVYVALQANVREPWAHVKTRGEVRGGGRKPWKQKGTGRARHGSTRSPIWTGGGVTFGPRNDRNYTQKVNKRMGKKAVAMCLSSKVQDTKLFALESVQFDGKTKNFAKLRNLVIAQNKSTLLITDENDTQLLLSVRNVPKVDVVRALDVNVVDLLHHQFVLTTPQALEILEKRLG